MSSPKIQLYFAERSAGGTMPTAILSHFTTSGFVLTADGKAHDVYGNAVSEDEQKLFQVGGLPSAAYALYGYVTFGGDEERPSVLEIKPEIDKLAASPSDSLLAFGNALSELLYLQLLKAKAEQGMTYPGFSEYLNGTTTILHVLLFGYQMGKPSALDIIFWHRDQKLGKPEPMPISLHPNLRAWGGSQKIVQGLFDPKCTALAKFREVLPPRPVEDVSLLEAAQIGSVYIKACESDEGRSIDPDIDHIYGGRSHIAAITPAGFSWLKPPKRSSA